MLLLDSSFMLLCNHFVNKLWLVNSKNISPGVISFLQSSTRNFKKQTAFLSVDSTSSRAWNSTTQRQWGQTIINHCEDIEVNINNSRQCTTWNLVPELRLALPPERTWSWCKKHLPAVKYRTLKMNKGRNTEIEWTAWRQKKPAQRYKWSENPVTVANCLLNGQYVICLNNMDFSWQLEGKIIICWIIRSVLLPREEFVPRVNS